MINDRLDNIVLIEARTLSAGGTHLQVNVSMAGLTIRRVVRQIVSDLSQHFGFLISFRLVDVGLKVHEFRERAADVHSEPGHSCAIGERES